MQGNGAITMTNVTMSGNSTLASGGGIYYNGTGLTLTNTTISGNTAATNAGGLHKSIATNNANIRNSIISGNTGGASPDVTNVFNSLGNNIIGTVGTSTGWIGSDLQNQNPLLSPLGSYGGQGYSHALLTGSPGINGGQNCVKDLTCVRRNNPPRCGRRPTNAGPFALDTADIGASKFQAVISPCFRAVFVKPAIQSCAGLPNVGSFTYTATGGTPPARNNRFDGSRRRGGERDADLGGRVHFRRRCDQRRRIRR